MMTDFQVGYESPVDGPGRGRIRNTYYSFGRPSVDPIPYFAATFFHDEISTFGFIKANYTTGYTMEMQFTSISNCEGQGDWEYCSPNNTLTVFSIEDQGILQRRFS